MLLQDAGTNTPSRGATPRLKEGVYTSMPRVQRARHTSEEKQAIPSDGRNSGWEASDAIDGALSQEEGEYTRPLNSGCWDPVSNGLLIEGPHPGIAPTTPSGACGDQSMMRSDGSLLAEQTGDKQQGTGRYHLRPRPVVSTRLKDFVLPLSRA
ncbi:hypothetical protein NDU88_005381 [Pleurodeles waltl]|uniref:Uncharacterized protein n=1 Tax=Pleurodeles waltl TaxID=8319 RepID=A0AAV7RLY7_PLEWA|nr:hypothetical protein NDU88_005381 [Pleurodeles waltl]